MISNDEGTISMCVGCLSNDEDFITMCGKDSSDCLDIITMPAAHFPNSGNVIPMCDIC